MINLIRTSLLSLAMTLPQTSTQAKQGECVILLHGLARSHHSMAKIERALNKAHYSTFNIAYPSTKLPIEVLAKQTIGRAIKNCPQSSPIHFVTHSMGGILLRQYLAEHKIDNLGRVVMLGPPNAGSQIVDKLHKLPGFSFVNGPAGQQLGTGENSLPKRLGRADFELGIIAGTRSLSPILSTFLPNEDDGKVSVESTKLAGMTDHISLPVNHTFMMRNDAIIRQIGHFLRHGKFKKNHLKL